MDIEKGHRFKSIDLLRLVFRCAPKTTIAEWICITVFSFLPAIQTVAVKEFIDSAVGIYNDKNAVFSIALPLVLMLFVICSQQANAVIMYVIDRKHKKELNKYWVTMILKKKSRLKYCYIEDNDVWDLIDRTCSNAPNDIYDSYRNIINFVQNLLQIISLLVVMMSYIWWAGLILLAVCIPMVFVAEKAGKVDYKAYELSDKIERKANYLHDTLMNRDTAAERSLFKYKDFLQLKWLGFSESSRKMYIKAMIGNTIKLKFAGLLITCVFIAMTVLFTNMLLMGNISSSVMIAVIGASKTFVNVFTWDISFNMMSFSKSKEYLADLSAFWELEEVVEIEKESADVQKFETLEFKNVSFRYPGTNKYILKDLSLKLNKERHYALVGPNGCGKTTLIKLITGLFNEYEGEILLNGREIREYSQNDLNKMFSVAFQDHAKYGLSLSENIRLRDNRDNDDMYDWIKSKLSLDRVADELPDKDDTILGKNQENGIDISGGEWQKIAIARSLYKASPFKILDEPTSALDPSAESEVYSMFQNICQGDTTLVITHRLGAAKFSDEIIVLSDGGVAEIGNHESLIRQNGIYYKMFMTQRRCFE